MVSVPMRIQWCANVGRLSVLLIVFLFNTNIAIANVFESYNENGHGSFTDYGYQINEHETYYEDAGLSFKSVNPQITVQIESIGFELSEQFERDIKLQVSIAYSVIEGYFFPQIDNNQSLIVKIKVVHDFDTFINMQQSKIGRIISHSGYYTLGDKVITVLRQASNQETFKTIKHEACHRVLHQFTQNRVRWLNEGIAENCENAEQNGNFVEINQNIENNRYINKMAISSRLIPMDEMLTLEANHAQQGNNAILSQIQSGQFIYFLLERPESEYWLSQLLLLERSQINIGHVQIRERLIDLEDEFVRWAKR
ncbi:hypothetical protein [Marinicellulosiphila megalodicopiae]|uniref:hypothetical protein n=1 Tax=Marinicellulosiphila megalodicopiae TaxID=2724896 RepID=UPI003BB1428C